MRGGGGRRPENLFESEQLWRLLSSSMLARHPPQSITVSSWADQSEPNT
jgi:hypothetical protein